MKEDSNDYIFSFVISDAGLALGKRPPLCDGCGTAIEPIEDEAIPQYRLNALILDGCRFHSVQCDSCVRRYFSAMKLLTADAVPKHIRQGVREELAHEMEVV